MNDPWIVLASIVGVSIVYVLLPVVVGAFLRFRGRRQLSCPETGRTAAVGVDAGWAAITSAFRHPLLRVESCSLWPERQGCGQNCLALLAETKPEPLGRAGS